MPRKLKSKDGNPYEIIRGMWEGAYVSHFVRLVRKKFGFSCVSTQELEDALVIDESVKLADICARLLRYLTGNTNILIQNFDVFLRNLLIKENAVVPKYLDNEATWHDLIPKEKLRILKWLIDYVLQKKEKDISDYFDENYSPDDLRGICAGQDAFNNIYWYLDDSRLYREINKKQKKEWECVCLTLSDWNSFLKQFRKTTNLQEKELYSYLNLELFPFVKVQLLKSSSVLLDIQEENNNLIKQEREELEVMLEKKTFLDCTNGLVKPVDASRTNTNDCEKHNGAITGINFGEGSDGAKHMINKTEDKSVSDSNHCDSDVSASRTSTSVNNIFSASKMNVESSTSVSACASSCQTLCTNTQDSSNVSKDTSEPCANDTLCSNSSSNTNPLLPSRDNAQDGNMVQPSSDNPSDSSSVTSNKENAPPTSGSTAADIPPVSAISNMVDSSIIPATTASVQPLPSNMVNKTSFPMETQYMQQQSQIFVFSTELANKAAESYLSGHFASIIAFHCAQPGTKSFLEKYPLKVQQFNRQNPAAWLNTLASMKQGGRPMKGSTNPFSPSIAMNNRLPGPMNPNPDGIQYTGPCNVHGRSMCSAQRGPGPWPNTLVGNGIGPMMPPEMCVHGWTPQQFGPCGNHRFPGPASQSMNARPVGPSCSPLLNQCSPNVSTANGNVAFQGPGLSACHGPGGPSTLTGVKVPDENLTPQQQQHRREQLAMIRKMHQLLFPEQKQVDQNPDSCGPPQNVGPVSSPLMQQGQPLRFGQPGDMCSHPSMESYFNHPQSCMNDHDHSQVPSDLFMNQGGMGPVFPPPPPNLAGSVTAQMEWQKLQHQFYEERRKKPSSCAGNMPLSHPSNSLQGQSTTLQAQPSAQLQMTTHTSQPETTLQSQQLLNSPSMGLSPSGVIQGPPPPPPYHQTPRRGMTSPHPSSPNPSSLSLPSPRMVSGLASPADPSRQFPHPTPPGPRLPHPSPGTVSSSGALHSTPINSPKPTSNSSGSNSNGTTLIKTPTTPSNTVSTPSSTPTSSCVNTLPTSGRSTPAGHTISNRKLGHGSEIQDSNSVPSVTSTNSDFTSPSSPVSTPSNVQGDIFRHNDHISTQSTAKKEHCGALLPPHCTKEPSLMPVPSPQQIQYLNAFDGQELTIQKQPNNSIRELDMVSPASVPPTMVMSSGSHFQSPDARSFPNTPGSCPAFENSQDSLSSSYPASAPASIEGNVLRFTVPSPQMPGLDSNSRPMCPATPTGKNPLPRFPGAHTMEMMKLPSSSSLAMDETNVRFPNSTQQPITFSQSQFGSGDQLGHFPGNVPDEMQNNHCGVPMEMLHSRFVNSSPHGPRSDMPQFRNMRPESMPSQSFSSPSHTTVSSGSPCMGGNISSENNIHSHLHNLQKMIPPYDSMVGNNVSSEVASPLGSCSSNPSLGSACNNNVTPFGVGSPMSPASQVPPSHRLSHFDPIASMAAMSESTGPMIVAGGNGHVTKNMRANMNLVNISVSGDSNINSEGNSVDLNPNMQPGRIGLQNAVTNIPPNQQQNQFNMPSQMPRSVGSVSQSMNNSYVSDTMPVQHHNVQNAAMTTATSLLNPNAPSFIPSMNSHGPMQNYPNLCQEGSTNTPSCTVTSNQLVIPNSVPNKSLNPSMCLPAQRLNNPYSGMPMVQRDAMPIGVASSPTMMGRPGSASTPSFNSSNIQVKANAPNTIQYLPARPQNVPSATNRPPSLEFLQKFAAPLTNLDNKVPTHNLQYFPNSRGSNIPPVHWGVSVGSSPGVVHGPGMMNNQRPVNMIMGSMMRGVNPVSLPRNQMFPVNSGMPGPDPNFGRPQCPSGSQLNSQMVPVNAMPDAHGVPMCPNKQMPMPMGGSAPDATQPLPPSMGQSFSYKHSPFYGPTTADPNYAVQFHNFQQQLYATNTRGSQMNSQNSGQSFFGAK